MKTARSAIHGQFVIERRFAGARERVFAVWADLEKKKRWFSCHDEWRELSFTLDFRVGGRESNRVQRPDGVIHAFDATFLDIVPGERIVYAYDMRVGDERMSASLVTVEFDSVFEEGARSEGREACRMRFTEQVVFLDGHGDLAERREGTAIGLERIDEFMV